MSRVCCKGGTIDGKMLECANHTHKCRGKHQYWRRDGNNKKTGHPCFICQVLETSDHLKPLNETDETRAGLSRLLDHPSCVSNICITKGYPRSNSDRLTFNEDTY